MDIDHNCIHDRISINRLLDYPIHKLRLVGN